MSPASVVVLALLGLAQADTVVIDPGHGGHDPGAVANGLYEADLNLEAGLAARDWMEADSADSSGGGSWDVHMTRESDVYISLSGRCDYANSLGADWFMSIHANAGGGDGTETYAYASGTTADDLAHMVQDEVLAHLGTNDRGVKYESFYVLVHTSMPADLTEMVFLDTWSNNAELMQDPENLDEVGLAHLHAIQRQTGLSSYTPGDDPDPGEPSGRVWFDAFPSSVEPGEDLSVTVGYQTDLHEFGERGELGLRMVDADSWETLQELSWDNGGTGLQGPDGDRSFDLQAPDEPGEIIFVAWLTPLGSGWDDRYDDASTTSSPTTVLDDGPVDTGEPPEPGEIQLLNVPGFIVSGQPFTVRVRYGEDIWPQRGSLGLQIVEQSRGLVAQDQIVAIEDVSGGVHEFSAFYEGPAEKIWFLTCAYDEDEPVGRADCLATDSSEGAPTRVMQGRERFIDGGCAGCSSRSATGAGWLLGLLGLLGLRIRRRVHG